MARLFPQRHKATTNREREREREKERIRTINEEERDLNLFRSEVWSSNSPLSLLSLFSTVDNFPWRKIIRRERFNMNFTVLKPKRDSLVTGIVKR